MDHKVKICVKLEPNVKLDLDKLVKDKGSNISKFVSSLVEETVYGNKKYIDNLYKGKLGSLMVEHMQTVLKWQSHYLG